MSVENVIAAAKLSKLYAGNDCYGKGMQRHQVNDFVDQLQTRECRKSICSCTESMLHADKTS